MFNWRLLTLLSMIVDLRIYNYFFSTVTIFSIIWITWSYYTKRNVILEQRKLAIHWKSKRILSFLWKKLVRMHALCNLKPYFLILNSWFLTVRGQFLYSKIFFAKTSSLIKYDIWENCFIPNDTVTGYLIENTFAKCAFVEYTFAKL